MARVSLKPKQGKQLALGISLCCQSMYLTRLSQFDGSIMVLHYLIEDSKGINIAPCRRFNLAQYFGPIGVIHGSIQPSGPDRPHPPGHPGHRCRRGPAGSLAEEVNPQFALWGTGGRTAEGCGLERFNCSTEFAELRPNSGRTFSDDFPTDQFGTSMRSLLNKNTLDFSRVFAGRANGI